MELLRGEFGGLGFENVETFIASGNVIFTARAGNGSAIERRVERHLQNVLGYEVATFVRTQEEVVAVARYAPFPAAAIRAAAALNIGFLPAPLQPAQRRTLEGLTTDIDTFHTHGRELYWLCRKKQSESTISNAAIERALKVRATLRGMNTIERLTERLAGRPAVERRGTRSR